MRVLLFSTIHCFEPLRLSRRPQSRAIATFGLGSQRGIKISVSREFSSRLFKFPPEVLPPSPQDDRCTTRHNQFVTASFSFDALDISGSISFRLRFDKLLFILASISPLSRSLCCDHSRCLSALRQSTCLSLQRPLMFLLCSLLASVELHSRSSGLFSIRLPLDFSVDRYRQLSPPDSRNCDTRR